MKSLIAGACLLILVVSVRVSAFDMPMDESSDVVQRTGQGEVNWTKGMISAIGHADMNQPIYAQQVAATADARANLLMILNEIHIARGIRVERGLLVEDINQQTVQGTLQGSTVSELKRDRNGMPYVVAYKKLTPDMLNSIMPEKYFAPEEGEMMFMPPKETDQPKVLIKELEPDAVLKTSQAAGQPEPKRKEVPLQPYTGLIIDAKGLNVTPSLGFNVMVSDSKEILYGVSSASRKKVIEKGGMAGYTTSVDKAKISPRVGNNPLVIKAVDTSGERNTDLFISKEDAARIYSENLKTSFLKDLRVVVVCGS